MMSSDQTLIINVDGGSRGNPGPAGAGAAIRDESGNVLWHIGVFLGKATNNVAEYGGLIAGLTKALELGARRVLVYSDSQLLIYQMTGVYRVKNEALSELHAQAKSLDEKFYDCRYEHIPRELNALADQLANQAMNMRKSFAKRLAAPAKAAGPASAPRPAHAATAAVEDGDLPQVAVVQMDVIWEDRRSNHAKAQSLLSAAKIKPGSLVILPEMFSTGFSMNLSACAQSSQRPDEQFLIQAAREHQAFVLGGVVIKGPDHKGRNQAVAFGPDGGEIARFTKLHLFTPGLEQDHFTAGDGPVVFDWNGVKVAPMVCYDLRFPEAFRAAVRQGAQVLAVLANWPQPREHHWLALLPARAVENQAYVAAVNRIGASPKEQYAGRSMIIDPGGRIIADAGSAEGVVRAGLDIAALREYRKKFPVLKDVRADLLK